MTDIFERLNGAMFDIKDKTRINPDLWNPLALAIYDATDEVMRLRDALKAAIENIDADDVIGAHEKLSAALGEEK